MNKKMLIGLGAVAVLGYLYYRHTQKSSTTTLSTGTPAMSNANGGRCVCKNGVSGWCGSGDCSKCCKGSGGSAKTETSID